MIMNIESLIKSAFERDAEQYRSGIPRFSNNIPVSPVFPDVGKRGKERYGSFIASLIIVVLISLFSLQTNMFDSSLVIHWADMAKLLPENPAEAFLHFLQAINSSM
jgi:hypothetical protein